MFAYHFESKSKNPADRAKAGAAAYDAYKASAVATREGLAAESRNSPEAAKRAQDKAARDAKLGNLRSQLASTLNSAAAAVAKTGKPNSTFDPVANQLAFETAERKRKLDEAAAGLIGKGVPTPAIPKGANEALDYNSAESMKAFMENKYAAYGDKALEVAEESKELLASIEAKMGDGGVGIA